MSFNHLSGHKKTTLIDYALRPFRESSDFQSFTYTGGKTLLNPLKQIIDLFFSGNEDWQSTTRRICGHLIQSTNHPNIKMDDLLCVHFDQIRCEEEVIDALGIYKCETLSNFLNVNHEQSSCVEIMEGYDLGKMDKGAIIFNTRNTEGNIVLAKDTTPGILARYWKEEFLNISPINEAYNQTTAYMNMAQTYVKHQLVEDIEMPKSEQLSMLYETGQFFKDNSKFVEKDYEAQVFHNKPDIVASFNQYKDNYSHELNQSLPSEFVVSDLAVKRSSRNFKSVLKLDKNFHVYIHGNRQMIEHGIDQNGRKFYKLFYEQER